MSARIVKDMAEAYHNTKAISKHYMDAFIKAPAAFRYAFEKPFQRSTSDTFLLGSLFHALLLEPEAVASTYKEKEFSGTTKAGKAEAEQAKKDGIVLVQKNIWETATNMANTLKSTSFWKTMENNNLNTEMSIYWDYDGMPCKARIDGFYTIEGRTFAFDLKSCVDASPKAISRDIALFGYHRQSVWYKSAMTRVGIPVDSFIFIFVEKQPPYLYNVCTINDGAECKANDEIREALEGLKKCFETNSWPGLCQEVISVDLPGWAYKTEESPVAI